VGAVEFACPNCDEPVVTSVPAGEITHIRHVGTDLDPARHVIVESASLGGSRVIHHCPVTIE